jgi:hypothetical protein
MTDQGPDSWEANAQYMLERCPYAVWQRPGGGPVDLKSTLVVTFQAMQMRLEGHPMYERKKDTIDAAALDRAADAAKGQG